MNNQTTKHLGLDAASLSAELRGFWGGSDQLYRTAMGTLSYTEGVRYFFNQAGTHGAYWLRDILATEPKVRSAVEGNGFVCVLLEVKEGGAAWLAVSLDAQTVGEAPNQKKLPIGLCFDRHFTWTDTQVGQWFFYIENDVMMLPNER